MESTKELYSCSYKEVITILSFLSDEDWEKIPKEKKDFYFNCMKKDYEFEFDDSKPVYEQDLLEPTKAILANIYKNYLASPEQKEEINNREKIEFEQIENEKREKYNPDDLFKSHKSNETVLEQNINMSVVIKKNGIFEKIFNYLKNIVKR